MSISIPATPTGVTSSNGANVSVTLPVASMALGDWIYIWGGHYYRSGVSIGPVNTEGWEELYSENAGGSTNACGLWRKLWDGSGSAIECYGPGTSGDGCVYIQLIVRNSDLVRNVSSPATGTATAPNAPAATVTAGLGDAVLIFGQSSVSDAAQGSISGYTITNNININTTRDMSASVGYKLVPTTNDDPAAWSAWATGNWRAITIVIQMAVPAANLSAGSPVLDAPLLQEIEPGVSTIYTADTVTSDSGLAGAYLRQLIPAGQDSGGQVRVTLEAYATNWPLVNVAIGVWSGTDANTTAMPVELLFSGASGCTVTTSGVRSDWADLTFSADDTLVVIMDPNGTVDVYPNTDDVTNNSWFGSTASYNQQSPTGFQAFSPTPSNYGLVKVEIKSQANHDTLSPAPLSAGQPNLGTATFNQRHTVTAAYGISSPSLGTVTFSQKQVLTAAYGITSPTLGAPVFAQSVILTASPLPGSSPSWTATTFNQNHKVTASYSIGAVSLGAPIITQKQVLTAAYGISSPTLGAPILSTTGEDVLEAAPLSAGSPTLGAPIITQKQVLTAAYGISSPSLGSVVFSQNNKLVAAYGISSPTWTAPALHQKHTLGQAGLSAGQPDLGIVSLSLLQTFTSPSYTTDPPFLDDYPAFDIATGDHDTLTAAPLSAGSPSLSAPQLSIKYVLGIQNFSTASPVWTTATFTQRHVLPAAPLSASTPTLGAPGITQRHTLPGANLSASNPALGSPVFTQKQVLVVSYGISSPTWTAPAIGQKHAIVAAYGISSPILGAPTLSTEGMDNLNAAPLITNAPTLGPANLSIKYVLGKQSFSTASPTIPAPAFFAASYLGIQNFTTGSPNLGSVVLHQNHKVVASYSISSPSLGVVNVSLKYVFVAPNFSAGHPVIPALSLAPVSYLGIQNFTTGSPNLGVANLSIKYQFTAAPLSAGAPNLPALWIGLAGILQPAPFTTSSPIFGAAVLRQKQLLVAAQLKAGNPNLGVATFKQNHRVTATPLSAGHEVFGSPVIGQNYHLTAAPLSAGAPQLEKPTFTEGSVWIASNLKVGSPAIPTPAFTQNHHFVTTGIADGHPAITKPAIHQDHHVTAVVPTIAAVIFGAPLLVRNLLPADLDVSTLELEAGILEQNHHFAASFRVSQIILGAPALETNAMRLRKRAKRVMGKSSMATVQGSAGGRIIGRVSQGDVSGRT